MSLEPLPLGFGDFSIAMAADDASLWPPQQLLQDLHCYQSVEELKQRLAAVRAELQATREEVCHKRHNIASLVEQVRRTAQERDLLREQRQLLLACQMEAFATPPAICPVITSSSLVSVERGGTFPAPSSAAALGPAAAASEVVTIFAPACPPLLTSLPPVAVDRATAFAVPSSGPATIDSRAAIEVPTFPSLVGKQRSEEAALELLAARRPLPKQGRLVQAVMEAGPLLQHLLVAGQLPRWRNPPPAQALADAMILAPSGSAAPMGLRWSIP